MQGKPKPVRAHEREVGKEIKMKVYFENIGYSNACFEAECKGELTYEWLYEKVKPYCMSRILEFIYNEETNEGTISGGLRIIGRFKIER